MTEAERQIRRADLWTQTFIAIAGNVRGSSDDAVSWANKAVDNFDIRFPQSMTTDTADIHCGKESGI